MSIRLRRLLSITILTLVPIALPSCGNWFKVLKARRAFQNANSAYLEKDYRKAVEEYHKVLELDPEGDRRILLPTYYYIGSSHHLIFSASRLDAVSRDRHISSAIEYYEKTIDLVEEGGEHQDQVADYRRYATEQFTAILKYKRLVLREQAKIEELRGNKRKHDELIEEANRYIDRERDIREEQEAGLDHMSMKQREDFIGRTNEQVDRALELNPENVDAMIYKGLVLREQAKIEELRGNKRKHDELIEEANRYRDRALEFKKEQ